jgi:hypothetical protein
VVLLDNIVDAPVRQRDAARQAAARLVANQEELFLGLSLHVFGLPLALLAKRSNFLVN